jgi:hypothetical protein
MTVVAEHELYRACKIIFGPDLTVSRKFLGYLQKSGVKRAFRKRVLETHPDRCVGRGELVRCRHVVMFYSLQLAILLSRQNRMKKRIGVYFVRHHLLTSAQMTEFVSQCRKHNSRQRSSAVSRF